MPANDFVPRAVRGVWRRAAAAGLEQLPVVEVGDEIRSALAKVVRDAEVPAAGDLVRELRESAAADDAERWRLSGDRFLEAAGRTDPATALVRHGETLFEL